MASQEKRRLIVSSRLIELRICMHFMIVHFDRPSICLIVGLPHLLTMKGPNEVS